MNEHFIMAVDRGQLRIVSEISVPGTCGTRFEMIDPSEFTIAGERYADPPLTVRTHYRTGGPIGSVTLLTDETSGRREERRKSARQLAAEVESFLRNHPSASWDIASSPAMYHAIVEGLSVEVRRKLKRVYSVHWFSRRLEEAHVDFTNAWSA